MNKLFSKEQINGHIIFTILGIKFKFIDISGLIQDNSVKLAEIEKSLSGGGKKEDPVNKAIEKYLYAIDERSKYDYLIGKLNPNVEISNQIWTCWLQGEENAPEIVKFCIDKIKEYYPNTIVITEDTINDYITLPDFFWDKYHRGIISPAHFADIVRVCLLDKYGGIWIDSTCYLSQHIPDFILKQNIFFLEDPNEKDLSNWFIKSVQNNFVIKSVKTFLFEYWKENNTIINYFLFHRFIKLSRVLHEEFKKQFGKRTGYTNKDAFSLMKNFENFNYDEDYYNLICNHMFIHKLSYRIDSSPVHCHSEFELALFLQKLKELDKKYKTEYEKV